jgi:hypothetical protein
MTPDPKEVGALANAIVEAEKRLEDLKRQWEAVFAPPKATRVKRDGTVSAKVMSVLAGEPDRIFSIAEVATTLSEEPLRVGRTLFRLSNMEQVASPGRGKYQAKESRLESAA